MTVTFDQYKVYKESLRAEILVETIQNGGASWMLAFDADKRLRRIWVAARREAGISPDDGDQGVSFEMFKIQMNYSTRKRYIQ